MARRFRGSEEVRIDAKGRLSIPAKFRRVFEAADPAFEQSRRPQLVVVYGMADWTHLRLYTIEAIDEIDMAISQMPRGSAERIYLETLMNGLSEEAEIDADGRLLLPQKLREKIGLADRVFLLASGDYLKLSTPESHESDLRAVERSMPPLQPGADPLSLLPAQGAGAALAPAAPMAIVPLAVAAHPVAAPSAALPVAPSAAPSASQTADPVAGQAPA